VRKSADVIVSLVAAVAVVVVVPAIVHGLVARILFVVLLLALISTIPMYFARRRKHHELPVADNHNSPVPAPTIIGIAAYDQAVATDNETNITVTYNAPRNEDSSTNE
jgi:hypothetical protein